MEPDPGPVGAGGGTEVESGSWDRWKTVAGAVGTVHHPQPAGAGTSSELVHRSCCSCSVTVVAALVPAERRRRHVGAGLRDDRKRHQQRNEDERQSEMCRGLSSDYGIRRATPARPPRGGPAGASSVRQLLAWFCPPCWPVPAELPAPLRAPLTAVWLALLAPP